MAGQIRVWVQGQLVEPDAPSIAALDHGVTVGDGAFETLKVVDGHPFAATRHLRRLERTMSGLGLEPPDPAMVQAGIDAVMSAGEPIGFGRLRYTITGGSGPLGSDRDGAPLTYIVTAAELPQRGGVPVLATVPWIRNERAATAGLKTTSYADNVIALAYAKARGASEAIFANTRDELCEGTGSNIFVVSDGVMRTPPLDSGALAGITRELVIEWSRAAGLEVHEGPITLSRAKDVDEVFITSSTRDVLPITTWDERTYAAPGPVTARVARIFAERSAADIDP